MPSASKNKTDRLYCVTKPWLHSDLNNSSYDKTGAPGTAMEHCVTHCDPWTNMQKKKKILSGACKWELGQLVGTESLGEFLTLCMPKIVSGKAEMECAKTPCKEWTMHRRKKSEWGFGFGDGSKARTVLWGAPGCVGEPLAVILHHEEGVRGRVQTHHVHALVHVLLKSSGWGSRSIDHKGACAREWVCKSVCACASIKALSAKSPWWTLGCVHW